MSIIDSSLKGQLSQYLQLLENKISIGISLDESENSKKLRDFILEIVSLSDKISVTEEKLNYTPSFSVNRLDEKTGIEFAGIPLGHEFESLVLALLQVGGRKPKISEEQFARIKAIDKELKFETIVSLSCHNCPDVVQALNILSVLNSKISHTMIVGGMFQELVDTKGIMAVPTVLLNGEEFIAGKTNLDKILDMIAGPKSDDKIKEIAKLDTLIIGGGPAAATAAIYLARKDWNTAIVCDEFGGQVKETLGIENITGTKYTEGPKYMAQVKEHVIEYNVPIFEGYKVESIEKGDEFKSKLNNGIEILSKTVIVATGARWRLLGIPGETEFKNKGIAYCVHCDGPLFKDKKVAVIGGGNSGIEAAIDLAPIAKEVVVLEFADTLKADDVLQDRARSLSNIEIITNAETTSIDGDNKVQGLTYTDRISGKSISRDIDGCFIQVGLVPNTEFLDNKVEKTRMGEIVVDGQGQSSIEGLFAAGDCTNTEFKQIVIASGSGASAALGVNNYLVRKK